MTTQNVLDVVVLAACIPAAGAALLGVFALLKGWLLRYVR
jgi:hypothetical protein